MGGEQSKGNARGKQKGCKDVTDLAKVIDDLKKLQTKDKNHLQAERSNILANGISYFKSPGIEFCTLEITMATSGVPEESSDLGGPTREFYTIFFKELLRKDIDMFEGQTQGRNLFPVNNDRAISGNWFTILGKAIVISLLSGGPSFPYLAPCIVSYIRERDHEHELNIGLVYNTILRQLIKRINNAETQEQLDAAMDSDTERFIDNCGWPRYQMITLENRLELTQTLLKWELIGKRATALDQLKKGLNTLSFLDKTAKVPDADNVLLHTNTEKATSDYLKVSLRKELDKLKTRNEEEERAKEFTRTCMEMMTDTEATSLFHFITGMSSLPVEDIPLEVEFNRANKKAELPESITCIQRLRIPLGNESQMAFYSSFHKALTVGKYGFGGTDAV